ncbi:ubl carboxyl-terminal hydrolase 18-like isoform X2 [Takifugu rubripes]|uniref:ubl carboxyl-terminal hydrolase 18-like isoform X2 n=1 Tax=Takifugu rubripes TaxID=31033 RepID=UPI001145D074|nr:ubl carboxyl-terminal hydrolase 18-like isoform X2 [Takifugu rubripes]
MSLRFCLVPLGKACSGLRGLSNHCLSCCVNALLQAFSATWELAELLDKWETAGVREEDENIPLNLRRVLVAMKSARPLLPPHKDFLLCLERNRIRRNTQHDADQVFLFILNAVVQQIDNRSLALEVQNLYKISTETHLQCSSCSSAQIQSSYLLNLQLPVKEEHDSLEGCLTSYFRHEELQGENCCFCPKCGTQTPSKWGVKLLSLPQVLCISFKRFRGNLDGTRKLHCVVTFPESFDFSEVVKEAFASSFTQNGCGYTLYAVVVHAGNASCGHYTAFVRHPSDQHWYHADDSRVKRVSWEEVKSAYGGSSRDTAYMLMYRRGPSEGLQPGLPT